MTDKEARKAIEKHSKMVREMEKQREKFYRSLSQKEFRVHVMRRLDDITKMVEPQLFPQFPPFIPSYKRE